MQQNISGGGLYLVSEQQNIRCVIKPLGRLFTIKQPAFFVIKQSNRMKKFNLHTTHIQMLADTISPVSLYLRFRDEFINTLLLESSDYHGSENSVSYLCFDPLAMFSVKKHEVTCSLPDGSVTVGEITSTKGVMDHLNEFLSGFDINKIAGRYAAQGLFGYIGYEAVKYFEDIRFRKKPDEYDIPDMHYQIFRYVIAIDHFKNELHLYEQNIIGEEKPSQLERVIHIIKSFDIPSYTFEPSNEEHSNYTDAEFLSILQKGKDLCQKGEVIQIVLSRRYQTNFIGDEFNVYRALRSINPSPYLFFFDYGSYKIFGSSPEAQIVIKNKHATIYPIAGTFKRTGSDDEDQKKAKALAADPKENAEHIMLVDLARNDLSRNGDNVKVETFKEVQFYSHVIHLVSKVTADLDRHTSSLRMVAETFPAGTLSGAPKFRAMQLIDELESTQRGYYGGAIGYLGLNGDFNHAIMIRSFLSKNNTLTYQAGAGVVARSSIESELKEVNNKLAALRSAIKMAIEI